MHQRQQERARVHLRVLIEQAHLNLQQQQFVQRRCHWQQLIQDLQLHEALLRDRHPSPPPFQLALLQQVDGKRTIREIVAEALASGVLPQRSRAELEQLGKDLVQTFWQLDVLAMGLERTADAALEAPQSVLR